MLVEGILNTCVFKSLNLLGVTCVPKVLWFMLLSLSISVIPQPVSLIVVVYLLPIETL